MTPNARRMLYFNSCYRKLRHEHSGTAIHHANHLSILQPRDKLSIYFCVFCAGLHVGHSNKEVTEDSIFVQTELDFISPSKRRLLEKKNEHRASSDSIGDRMLYRSLQAETGVA